MLTCLFQRRKERIDDNNYAYERHILENPRLVTNVTISIWLLFFLCS